MRAAISERRPGILTYGITPPKKSSSEQKRQEIAARQVARIAALPVDALVIYDLQDESTRTRVERPFPYMECIDPVEYAYDYLSELTLPRVVYRCVAPLTPTALELSLRRIDENAGSCVLVGAASRSQSSSMRLPEAYALRNSGLPKLPVGGVLIAERHELRGGEDQRTLHKMTEGCSFFITQAVYSAVASKNVLSDLYYRCEDRGMPVPPVLVTLSPCGSEKTLDFMAWLGVMVPRWLENELRHSHDILAASVDVCVGVFEDLLGFAQERGIPLGCNVESVSLRKAEIDASVELVGRISRLMTRER
jgi:hypothetical protein